MGELGLFGLPFPEEYGGSGADFTTLCVAIEELARVDSSMAITLEAGVGLGANPIFRFGTEEQRQRWLPDLCAGRALGAFGLTEPEAGSDAGATRTRATLDEDGRGVGDRRREGVHHQLRHPDHLGDHRDGPHGRAGGDLVDHRAGRHARARGRAAVPQDGLARLGHPRPAVSTGCRVPERQPPRGAGPRASPSSWPSSTTGGSPSRPWPSGLAQACLEQSVAYAKERQAFGGPIGRYQAVAFKCADMAVAVEAARTLTYKAAWLKDHGRPFKQAAAMAKLYATEAAVTATREATQIFGGYGFMDETPVSRFYRDAKILEIGEGTSEVQRLVISRGLGLPVE